MSYTVLARKYRPQKFSDVVGQAHVSQSLENALGMGRVAHAYLFSGTRGVGKTTTARILAKALNCATGPAPVPCGECDSCREVTVGSSVDVMEIDAASNTGVDNVRDLCGNAKYSPAKSRYKVYIIDEVHMLSTAAFNALLKTLEEPPGHVIFIFATTDPHKVPATILSRCQHYSFKRVSKALIMSHMKSLCEKESLKAEDAALSRLAELAEGSVRDGLSLLDQVVSYCGEEGVKETDIDDILGLVGREAVLQAARAIVGQDAAGALDSVDALVDGGHDLRRFAASLLETFRDILTVKVSPKSDRPLDMPVSQADEVRRLASEVSPEEILRVMNILARLADEMKSAFSQRTSLEMALVKAASRPISSVGDVLEGLKRMKDAPSAPRACAPQTVKSAAPREIREDASYYDHPGAPEVQAEQGSAVDLWVRVREEIKQGGKAPLAAKMERAAPRGVEGNVLTIAEGFLAFRPDEAALIKEAAQRVSPGLIVKFVKGNGTKEKSLADVKKERETVKKEKFKSEALDNPVVKSALQLFGGEIVEEGEKR